MSLRLYKISTPLLLASLLLGFSPRLSYGGGCGPGCAGYICDTHGAGVESLSRWMSVPFRGNPFNVVRGTSWIFEKTLGRFARWAYGAYRESIVPGPARGPLEVSLNQIAEEGAIQGIGVFGPMAVGGVIGSVRGIVRGGMALEPPVSLRLPASIEDSTMLIPSPRLQRAWGGSFYPPSRNLFGRISMPDAPIIAPGEVKAVEMGGVRYLEFDPSRASVNDMSVSMGGNATSETGVAISPWGEVVVFEGKHRAIGAAVGNPVALNEGGIAGSTRLRFEDVGKKISLSDWERWRAQFVPMPEMIRNPRIVEAAMSGATKNNWTFVKEGVRFTVRR